MTKEEKEYLIKAHKFTAMILLILRTLNKKMNYLNC